jgi:hypothetical protein
MTYKIKWVTEEEYAKLLKEWQERSVLPSGYDMDMSKGFKDILTWDEHSSQPMLVQVATHSLIKALL